jgi:two-component system response regulator MtrA
MARARRPSVLIVEDDAAIARGLETLLAGGGFRVTRVSSGEDALASVRLGGPDAVLLDINLPGIDGVQVCRTLRAERYRGVIVFLTARSGSADRVAGLEAGADDFFPKPFDGRELLARIRSRLDMKTTERRPPP